jgi:hypothetical protein
MTRLADAKLAAQLVRPGDRSPIHGSNWAVRIGHVGAVPEPAGVALMLPAAPGPALPVRRARGPAA